MSKRDDIDFLYDIREAISRIEEYTSVMTYEDFLNDLKTQDAVIRNLEIVGEATKNLSFEFRNKYEYIPWKEMAGLRDKLIHQYFGVNIDIVWDIAINELPGLGLKLDVIV